MTTGYASKTEIFLKDALRRLPEIFWKELCVKQEDLTLPPHNRLSHSLTCIEIDLRVKIGFPFILSAIATIISAEEHQEENLVHLAGDSSSSPRIFSAMY